MKYFSLILLVVATAWTTSCAPQIPAGNVEGLERQTPVTQDPNAIGDALNARNAVDYSNGQSYGYGRGRYGY